MIEQQDVQISKDDFNHLVELFNRRSKFDVLGIPDEEHRALGQVIDMLRGAINKEKQMEQQVTKYIIVKYATDNYPSGIAPLGIAVHPDSYSARQCGIVKEYFTDRPEAEAALEKLMGFNPAVGYGIVQGES